MNRTGWLAVIALALLGVGVAVALHRPKPALDCPPERLHFVDAGVGPPLAVCGEGASPGGAVLSVGGKLDLNHATEAELSLLPGVGQTLAHDLVEARGRAGGFKSWDDVDRVPGVGPARAEMLRSHTELRPR